MRPCSCGEDDDARALRRLEEVKVVQDRAIFSYDEDALKNVLRQEPQMHIQWAPCAPLNLGRCMDESAAEASC